MENHKDNRILELLYELLLSNLERNRKGETGWTK